MSTNIVIDLIQLVFYGYSFPAIISWGFQRLRNYLLGREDDLDDLFWSIIPIINIIFAIMEIIFFVIGLLIFSITWIYNKLKK